MKKKKLWIILGSVFLFLAIVGIVLPITLLSINEKNNLNLVFESKTFVYNGNYHYLEVEGDIPSDVEINYENNGHKDVGTYEVIAHIQCATKTYPDLTATMTIIPFELENIEFKDQTIPYDGKVHSIFISGELPEGINVTYDNNENKNVGTYEVTAHFHSIEKSVEGLGTLTARLTIEPIKLDLSNFVFESQSFIYDGTVKSVEVVGELPEGISISYENNYQVNAGIYEVTAVFIDSLGNYIISDTMSATLTIDKATYDMSLVSFNSIEIPYDGNEHVLLIDGVLPEGVSVLGYTNNKRTDIGESLCRVEFLGDERNYYEIAPMTATLTICKGKMSFLTQTVFYTTYTGFSQSLVYKDLPEGISVIYGTNEFLDAGTYSVLAYFKDELGRYEEEELELTFIIQKASYDLSGIIFEDEIYIYDGEMHFLFIHGVLPDQVQVSYTPNGLVEVGQIEVVASFTIPDPKNYNPIPSKTALLTIVPQELDSVVLRDATYSYDGTYHYLVLEGELPLGVTFEYINNAQIEVGSYEVIVKFNVTGYKELKATLTITKADIDMSNVYFNGATFVYDASPHSIYITGELPSTVNVLYENNTRTDIGRQTAVAHFELLEPEHYNEIPSLYAELIIIENQITGISFQDKVVVYDQQEHSLFIEGELPEGVNVTYTNNGQKNAGVYEVIAHFTDSTGKYQSLEDMVANLTILQAQFARNGIIFADKEFVYDGAYHSLEIYCDDIPDDIEVIYANNHQVNAGIYEVVVSFKDLNNNYIPIADLTATLTIQRCKLNLDDIIFEDEEYEYDGFEHTLTIHGTLPEGVEVSYTKNSLTKLDRILVTATFIVDERNYEPIPSRTAYLTITKGVLENVFLYDETITYDGQVHSLFIEGELPLGVSVVYHNNDQENAGIYKVVADLYDSEGYYHSLSAHLTILKAVYDMSSVSFSNATYVYDGLPHTLEISGDLPEGVEVMYSQNTLVNAGVLWVTASFIGNPNYEDIPALQAVLTIEKITITDISFEGATFDYDSEVHKITVTGVEGYPITVLYYNNEKIDAGTYEVIASFILLNENYNEIADKKAMLIIQAIPMGEVTLEDQTFILDGTAHSLYTTSTLPEGVSAVYENNGQIYEGSYIVKMWFESTTPNYILPEPIYATMVIVSDGSYHTVIFHIDEETEDIRIVKNGDGIEDIPTPSKKLGYDGHFEGDFTQITSRMDFYPVYEPSTFRIFFDDDSSNFIEVKYLSQFILPIPEKEDYIFKRWVDSLGNEITDGIYQWTEDISLYSVWQCLVTIKNINDYVYEEITLDSNALVQPVYPYSSYLTGFYLDKEFTTPFDLSKPVLKNQILYVRYEYDFDFIMNENDEVIVTQLLDNTKESYRLTDLVYDLYPIVSIPMGLFSGCSNLKELSLPVLENDFGMLFGSEAYENSVLLEQREGSFYVPKDLTTVEISSPIIPTLSFWNCTFITKLILRNVEEVEGFAFENCSNLEELYLYNCRDFDESCFIDCNRLDLLYCDSLEGWMNLSFYNEMSNPMYYANVLLVDDEIIHDFEIEAAEIGNYQFYGFTQMESIKLKGTIILGNQAFMGCSALTRIWIDQTLEVSTMDAFAGAKELSEIYYAGSIEDWSNIVFQNQYASPMYYMADFYVLQDGDYLQEAEIVLDRETIGDYQFYGFQNIRILSLKGVNHIGYKAFANMGIVDEFFMPSTLLDIEEDAFVNTTFMNVTYDGGIESWANMHFNNAYATPLWSNQGELTFDSFDFNLEEIVLPASLQSVDAYQFFGFKHTKSVETSTSLTYIGSNAFANCAELEQFSFGTNDNLIIMENAFLDCKMLKDIYFVGSMDDYLKITYKNIASTPLYYHGNLYVNGQLVEEVTLSTSVNDYLFYGLLSLKKVNLTSTASKIGRYAFANCEQLSAIENSQWITSLGDSAFEATGLLHLDLSGISAVPSSCFRNASALLDVELPNATSIGASAFLGCSSLQSIDLSHMKTIGNSAFKGCGSLKSIELNEVTIIEHDTFSNCYGLEEVKLSDTLNRIAFAAFYGCTKLEKIYIPQSVSIIESNAFAAALNLVVYTLNLKAPSGWQANWSVGVKEVCWNSIC